MSTDYQKILDDKSRKDEIINNSMHIFMHLYSDKTHFIFELLQNAEDVRAKKIKFNLFNDRLEVWHDGRVFNEKDVRGICSIGAGTKRGDLTQIGKFGIGFKSVYAYTKTPEIHSGDEHFKIINYVDPHKISKKHPDRQWTTIFMFPFDSPNINIKDTFQEIENGLVKNINARTLLFLRHIKEVEYNISGNSGFYIKEIKELKGANRVKIIGQKNNKNIEEESWLIFDREINDYQDSEIRVEVAFLLMNDPKTDQEIITKIHNSPLIVFFPTEKETRLGFLIQGPYRTTPARDNIPKDDQWNKKLISETAELIVDALLNLKNMKLLSVSLLECLPIKSKDFTEEEMFYPIFEKIKNALFENDLLPAHNNSFANAKCAKLARVDALRELLSSDQLQQLCLSEDCLFWLTGEITQDRTPDLRTFLIDELNIEEIRPETFANKITKEFLENQTDLWIIEFYAYLNSHRGPKSLWEYPHSELRKKEIIRLNDGTHVKPFNDNREPNAFLPPTDNPEYPEVKRNIVQDERSLGFLKEGLKLSGIGEKEAIQSIIRSHYISNTPNLNFDDHFAHMKRFVLWWSKNRNIELFRDCFLFLDKDKKIFSTGERFYIDSPIKDTALRCIFNSKVFKDEKDEIRNPLWEEYKNIEGFSDFAIALGVMEELTIKETNLNDNPDYRSMVNRCRYKKPDGTLGSSPIERYETFIKDDYTIAGLNKYLSAEDVHISRLIWNAVKAMDPKFLKARYRPNRQYNTQFSPSQLVHSLKENEWIPTKKEDFVKPSQATKDDLLEDFIYDDRNGWLTAIGFGCEAQKTVEKKENLKILGIENEEAFELFQKHQNKPDFIRHLTSYDDSQKSKPAFPERNSANPDRRKERLENSIPDSPDKKYEDKKRSVRTSSPDGDPKVWLTNQYTNDDEQLICQICQLEMPFKKPDGEYYFETVEIFDKQTVEKEREESYLALCPTCAAKYRIFIKNDKNALKKLKESIISSESPEIELILNEKASIRFVETHFQDLKKILRDVNN